MPRLEEVAPPPRDPVETTGAGGWQAVERQLGLTLPTDYHRLIDRYGTGQFGQFLWVLNPFTSNKNLNLLVHGRAILDADRELREAWPDVVPHALFPEAGGLLPAAVTDNGDRLYWRTTGDSDSWSIVLCESRGPGVEYHPSVLSVVIRDWLLGNLPSKIIAPPRLPAEIEFAPWRDKT